MQSIQYFADYRLLIYKLHNNGSYKLDNMFLKPVSLLHTPRRGRRVLKNLNSLFIINQCWRNTANISIIYAHKFIHTIQNMY